MEICRGNQTKAYVDYCVHRIRMLLHFNVMPVLVFDGADLPMKADTHAERRVAREKALAEAEASYARGDRSTAAQLYQRACPVTSEMARHVIRQCRQMNVEYVVAPFEADAQLAWMMHVGHIDSIITEDSDLLVYGASKIFFKMDRQGSGELFQSKNLPSLQKISLANFTEDMIVYMCVCAGCDFFKGVHGLGILKAHGIVRRHRTMSRIIRAIHLDNRYRVSKTFTADFARACLVFRHQTVFDLRTGKTVPLRPLTDSSIASLPNGVISKNDDGISDLSFLGRHLENSLAKLVAQGCIHPRSLKEYDEPLDIVERPMLLSKSNSDPHQPVRLASQSKPPSGFLVKGVVPSSTAKASQRPVFSIPPPKPSHPAVKNLLQRTPNLKQRLGTPKPRSNSATVFYPLREARKFRSTNKARLLQKPLNRTATGIWEKFQNGNCLTEPSPAADSTKPESDLSLDSDGVLVDLTANKSNIGSKRDTQKLAMSNGLEEVQDTPAPKRPRHLSSSPNRKEAVVRAVDKFAVVSSNSARDRRHETICPPSPDCDSFKLFDEIDEFSRDCVNQGGQSNVFQGPIINKSLEHTLGPTTSGARHSKAPPLATSRTMSGLPLNGNLHLRKSRFFTASQGGTKAKAHVAGKAIDNSKIKHPQVPGTASQVTMALIRESAGQTLTRFDNLRHGATGKAVAIRGTAANNQ